MMYQQKEIKIATPQMAKELVDRYYEVDFSKIEEFFKSILRNANISQKSLESLNDHSIFNNKELLNDVDEYEDKLIQLADLANVLDYDDMNYINEEEYQMCARYFIKESAEFMTDMLLFFHQLRLD